MKKLLPAVAIILGCVSVAWAADSAPLTTLSAIHALTNEEAGRALPVAFEATVTYFRGYDHFLTVQDGSMAIFVRATTTAKLLPGDRILVRGTTKSSLRPAVLSHDITLLRHGVMPKPVPATYKQLVSSRFDCLLVAVHGAIRSADLVLGASNPVLSGRIRMLMDGGDVAVHVDTNDEDALEGLLDAEVEVTGVVEGRFDGKYQLTAIGLDVSSLANVKILHRAGVRPWSLPITPMDQILSGYYVQNLSRRMRVHGTITYYQPGSAVVLESGTKSLWIATRTSAPLRMGDQADATGFPAVLNGFLTLTEGEIRDHLLPSPITPLPVTWRQLVDSRHFFDLVSIQGEVVGEVRERAQDLYILSSDGQVFSAIYRHPETAGLIPPPMKQIPPGSTVNVSGICIAILENSKPTDHEAPFNILMRSPDDITVAAGPSWLNVRNLTLLVGVLLLAVIAAGAREWYVERRVRHETGALAYIERRRGGILEDINGSRPLAEIVEGITELASLSLHGAPCWCQIADGAQLGNCPPKLTALRIVRHQIPARTGPPLGMIFAGFDPLAKPRANESEALSMAAELATLAIETRRLYTDLRHRSEFDLLTDIHNRFSLGKHLDAMIEEARRKAGIFGLIYMDLDKFKQVNDLCGHQTGDLYLQEAALRMKRQLRPGDLLARLGGDEFAALVSVVRNRAEAEEIAVRLERCFDEPFALEGHLLHGSVSIGLALYPEDGASQDSLLRAADAAMYQAKNIKKQIRQEMS
jgi:diguanylate cyclase (GGDEF)-like protein